ncbi:MAG TPA: hypothetical protein VF120_01510 [Ktedonobacterales bacterium]
MGRNGASDFDDDNSGRPRHASDWAGAREPREQSFGAYYYQPPQQNPGGGWGGSGSPWPQGSEPTPPPYAPSSSDAPTESWGAPPPYPPTYPGYASPPSQGYPAAYPYNPYGAPPPPPRKSRVGLIIGIVVAVVVVACLGSLAGLYALGKYELAREATATQTAEASAPVTTPPGTSASPAVLYQDQLNVDSKGWADDDQCFLRSDGLHVRNNYICYVPAGTLTDAEMSVQVTQISGSTLVPYGIALRRATKGNYYHFAIDSNSKAVVFKCEAATDECTKLLDYTPNSAIRGGLNTSNTLDVKAVGSHFVFSINGAIVAQIDDSTYPSGIAALATGDGIETVYTNLKITQAS